MKSIAIVLFSLCVAANFAGSSAKPAAPSKTNTYTQKYDGINLDEILNNPKLVQNYVECLVSAHKCTPQGKELREHLPEALKTECAKCTTAQKNGAIKVMNKLQHDYPEQWKKLSEKWDPTGEYFRKLANVQSTAVKKH